MGLFNKGKKSLDIQIKKDETGLPVKVVRAEEMQNKYRRETIDSAAGINGFKKGGAIFSRPLSAEAASELAQKEKEIMGATLIESASSIEQKVSRYPHGAPPKIPTGWKSGYGKAPRGATFVCPYFDDHGHRYVRLKLNRGARQTWDASYPEYSEYICSEEPDKHGFIKSKEIYWVIKEENLPKKPIKKMRKPARRRPPRPRNIQ